MTGIDAALAGLGAAFLLALVRVAKGPTLADRAVAADVCLVSLLGVIALLSVRLHSTHFLDAVALAALLHFISTLALSRLLEARERR